MRWASGLVLLAGCTVAVEDYGRVMGQAICERAQRCGELVQTVDCKHPGAWSDSPHELLLLSAGHVGYSSSSAAACVERIRTAKCGVSALQTDECRAAFPGKLAQGAACGGHTFDGCASGLLCANRTVIECGVCVPTTPEGERPDPDHPCARGLRRGFLDGGVACIPRGDVGEACGSSADCLEWLSCSAHSGTLGGSCRDEYPASNGGPPTDGAEGQPCLLSGSVGAPSRVCFSGLRCVNDRCVPSANFAEACESDVDCLSAHCIGGTCAAPRAAGSPCTVQNCGGGLWCENGTCQPSLCE